MPRDGSSSRFPQRGKELIIEAIVFDCDGVLVDSERLFVTIDQQVFRELGWEATVEEITTRFVGKSGRDYEKALRSVLGPLPDDWREPYSHLYAQAMSERLTAVDGVEAALQSIPLPKAVASNSSRDALRASLTVTSLLPYFDDRVVSVDDVEHGKPEPDVYLRAAELLGLSPEQCIAVEDSPTGATAALAAGMHVLGYGGGLVPPGALSELGASVFMSMDELPAIVAELT